MDEREIQNEYQKKGLKIMNSSWGYESSRNLDKTHLSNPGIAASGPNPAAPNAPISSSRSRKSFDRDLEPMEEEEKTRRYNRASTNGSDNYGVGYIDEGEYKNSSKEDEENTTTTRSPAQAPAHEDSIYKVMSHNFGKAKAQILRNDSVTNSQSLAAAYMSRRGEELEDETNSFDVRRKESTEDNTGGDGEGKGVGGCCWLHLLSEFEHEQNMKVLVDFNISVWDYSKSKLVSFAWSMFHDAGLIEEFEIPAKKFENFVSAIFETSHDVPYHNYNHYFVVLHTSWLLLKTNPILMSNLTKTDLLGCLTGAIGHDADHPGLTNSFLSATKDKLSIRYNDLSILENHHCATTYTIMSREECNIFCNLSGEDWKATRNVVVSAILNTDMARHFNLVANFVKIFKNKTPYECTANRNLRNQIISMVVHCADISNPVKPWVVAKRFADAVAQEFRNQVQREKAHGVPCTPHMLGLNTKGQAKMELGFIDVFTWPAIVALNNVLPNLDTCFSNMEQNREFWQDIMENSSYSSKSRKNTPTK
mmetsp:Transcript_2069/g.6704  ORF Transcript_2069/g.6704 Transcript_2069/m.6704 type:complete len:535 (+) Transcript_2069:273-1877(+)